MAIYYSVKQVAVIIEVSVRMVNYHIQHGNLVARKVVGIYSISSKDLDKFFEDYLYSERFQNKSRLNSTKWVEAMKNKKNSKKSA